MTDDVIMLPDGSMEGNMKLFTMKKIIVLFTVIALLIMLPEVKQTANAADNTGKKGLVIANAKGSYTFYDLKNTDGTASIETTASGVVMVPLDQIAKLLPSWTCQYRSSQKTVTVKNTSNGKRLIFKQGSNYLSYYSSSSASSVKKKISAKVYLTKAGSSFMVPVNTLRWLFQSTSGYQYYKTADMQSAGYDTYDYNGMILYNPYKAVSSIPKATNVTGISATVKVTIPEGYSIPQIFNLLVKKGVCASADFLYNAMEKEDFTGVCTLLKDIPANENRCYQLEGYLFPDTYEFYRLSSGYNALVRILKNTERKITQEYRDKAAQMGYSVDEIITAASIAQIEAGNQTMLADITSVIYNRLDVKMKIQCDATKYYLTRYVMPVISGDNTRYNSFYNTYVCAALPAGPICNPGLAAIKAALYPNTTDYLFFYSDSNGEYHFSHTYVSPEAAGSSDNSSSIGSE